MLFGGSVHAAPIADSTIQNREINVNNTSKTLAKLKTAVTAYYLERDGWPTTLSQLTSGSEPFYSGELSTALGTFSSSVTGNAFLLKFTARNSQEDTLAMVKSVSDLSASIYNNGSFESVVPTPQTADIVTNMLSRTVDTNGENAMLTDLHMGGNDLVDINKIFATDIEVSETVTANAIDANSLTASNFNSLNAVVTDVTLNEATFQKLTVNTDVTASSINADQITVNSGSVGASVNAESFDINFLKATNAFIKEATGDTAEINNATFNIETTTSVLTVDQKLDADSAQVDVISAYKQTPIQFASTVNFNDVTFNDTLNLSSHLYVNGASTLDNVSTESLNVNGGLSATQTTINGALVSNGQATITDNARLLKNLNAREVFANSAEFASSVTASQGVEIEGQLNVGSSIKQGGQIIADASTLYDNGVALSAKLLAVDGTAYDADKVDGYSSSQIAQKGKANTFSGTQSFKGTVSVGGNVYVGGKLVVDSNGYLYDGGTSVRNLYATKTEAAEAYADWDQSIASLRSRMNSNVNSLKSDHSSVGSLLSTAEAKANSQKQTLDNISSDILNLTKQQTNLDSKIKTLQTARQSEETKLASSVTKLSSGPTYKTRTCTITTTRTETGVGTGQFTSVVENNCGTWTNPDTVSVQYGKVN